LGEVLVMRLDDAVAATRRDTVARGTDPERFSDGYRIVAKEAAGSFTVAFKMFGPSHTTNLYYLMGAASRHHWVGLV
jgi:hypothetical protein